MAPINNVVYKEQKEKYTCAQTALFSVIESYNSGVIEVEDIEGMLSFEKGKGTSTIELGIISAYLGYKTNFYTTDPLYNTNYDNYDFYKNHSTITLEKSKHNLELAYKYGVNVERKILTLDNIKKEIDLGNIPIVLIDRCYIYGTKDGYEGHFVPVVGYEGGNIVIHEQSIENTEKFKYVEEEVFEKARNATGTDNDVLVIEKKYISKVILETKKRVKNILEK